MCDLKTLVLVRKLRLFYVLVCKIALHFSRAGLVFAAISTKTVKQRHVALAIDARHAVDRLISVDEVALDRCLACPSNGNEQLLVCLVCTKYRYC